MGLDGCIPQGIRVLCLFLALFSFSLSTTICAHAEDYVPGMIIFKPRPERAPQRGATTTNIVAYQLRAVSKRAPALGDLLLKYARSKRERALKVFSKSGGISLLGLDKAADEGGTQRILTLNLKRSLDPKTVCSSLIKTKQVEYCEPNYIYRTTALPNDTYVDPEGDGNWSSGAWGNSYSDLWGLQMIEGVPAWESPLCPNGCKGQGVVVAVLDTGVDSKHPDIASNIYINTAEIPDNNIDDDKNGYVDDVNGWNTCEINATGPGYKGCFQAFNNTFDGNGHGTHVAGTIAALANNGKGIAGVAPLAKILPVRGLGELGDGSATGLANGLLYPTVLLDRDRNGKVDVPLVINNSWGAGPDQVSQTIENAVRTASARGAVLIFAAGNSNDNVKRYSPQRMDQAITVASVDDAGYKSSFSNHGLRVDVAAPGGGNFLPQPFKIPSYSILSLRPVSAYSGITNYKDILVGDQAVRLAGTSMAAPHVSGVAALILSRRPELNFQQVRSILINSAIPAKQMAGDPPIGSGVVNALAAINMTTSKVMIEPGQFIAKMYTELLGRAPDHYGWKYYLEQIHKQGCSVDTLRDTARSFYLSNEFLERYSSTSARLLTLYRGALNREPDAGGFAYWLDLLNAGRPTPLDAWKNAVNEFVKCDEFANLVPAICSGLSYGFGGAPAIPLPTAGENLVPPGTKIISGGTGTDLQRLLSAAKSGETVYLAQRALIRATTSIVVPSGVILSTVGAPSRYAHAMMGRIVRSADFNDPTVKLMSGAQLKSVWLDGQRNAGFGYNFHTDQPLAVERSDVKILGGNNSRIEGCFFSNTSGFTSVHLYGSAEGLPCGSAYVGNNLITTFSSHHVIDPTRGGIGFANGIVNGCENAFIENNEIVDASGVGIQAFKSTPAVQRSMTRNNAIINTGNSSYAGIAIETSPNALPGGQEMDFTGCTFAGNILWTSRTAHMDIGLSVGRGPWGRGAMGRGAIFDGNRTGPADIPMADHIGLRTGNGIVVSGMNSAIVQRNSLKAELLPLLQNVCPHVNVAVGESAGTALNGDIQPHADLNVEGCLNAGVH